MKINQKGYLKISYLKKIIYRFTCRCPLNAMDRSPDKEHRPGRKCILQINECANPSLNNCSRFADCFDKPEGYECKCRSDYYDLNTAQPGTSCKFSKN